MGGLDVMGSPGVMGGLVVILSGFPRHSETFALNEVRALAERGLLTAAFAIKAGDGMPLHPGYEHLYRLVEVLPETDTETQAETITKRLAGKNVGAIHAYFAHTPTDVAMKVAARLNVPYGFSTHAKDARKVSPAKLEQRAKGASCVVACNADVASDLKQLGASVTLMPHGVDLQRFTPQAFPDLPLNLLAVGRLVTKKGFDVLLRAAARLEFPFQLRIVGDGPEEKNLLALVRANELGAQVEFVGSLSHAELPEEYAKAHVVVVPSVVDHSGDRDGLPNVVLEAMACGRVVVATDVGAITSAIISGYNGVLSTANNPAQLAEVLTGLHRQPKLLRELGGNARVVAERDYDLAKCSQRFCDFLADTYHLSRAAQLSEVIAA
jgi:glycosyltransferase involved in cell wall biosynthesis